MDSRNNKLERRKADEQEKDNYKDDATWSTMFASDWMDIYL